MREILAKSLWLQILVVAAAYAATARLSLLIAIPPGIFGTIWPPSGIALAALLLGGRRLWPGVFLGSVAIVLLTFLQEGNFPFLLPVVAIAIALGAGASLQAVAGASLVRRFTRGRNPLDRQRDVMAFLFWGGFVSCTVSATLGVVTLYFSGHLGPGNLLFSWGTWWAGDTIGTLLIAPLVLLWAEDRPAWLRRRLSVTIPLAATLAIVLLLFLFATRREEEATHAAFAERAQDFTSAIRASCEDHLEALHSMTLVLSMLPAIGPQDFQTIVAGVLEHSPGIQALSWNPRIDRAQRAALERQRQGPAGFRITERDAQGRLRPAALRDEYVPVLYIEPQTANERDERALGFDVASEPVRREALERARDTGEVAATRRIRLVVQTGETQHAVLLFSPVYSSGTVPATREERRERLRGYATAALRMDQLVQKAVKKLRLEGMTFALLDTDATGPRRILFADSRWEQRLDDPKGLELGESFFLGGRPWEIHVVATQPSPSHGRPWRSSFVLAAGLMFTWLLGAFLLVVTSRATQVEELVVRRTIELQRELVEHQRTGEVLRASEARYRAIFDHMIGGMITFDGESRIESVNPAAEKIFGYREDELAGGSVAVLMAESPRSDPDSYLRRVHQEALGRVTEWQGRRKNGEIFPFEVALFGFDTPAGRRFAANIQDISERREVDRLKSEFVATVSHELRTPLTSIRGSLGLLAGGVAGEVPPQGRELVRLAERNAVRLTALINDILDFESLDTNRVSMQLAAVELQALVEQSFESVRTFADEHRISLASRPAGVRVWADAGRIVQVLVNLLSNAIKFSPAGREVRVSAEDHGSRVRIFVRDHGRGIPVTHRQRIFERFVQVEVADKRDQGGTGLGLAICKAIVEHHGGHIGVDSEEGVGSTFWFELPAVPGG
ncbi:MAG TPA: CHASE domain-containing protein [Thermoanaerobaculia bacterium]|nr:CHASE domain-containing protein [Thermoanaerobaculia bacterium]